MFIGREREIARLTEENWRDQAELIAIYGRRRVGKTALIEHAFKNKKTAFWKFEGLEGGSKKSQIEHFLFTLSELSGDNSFLNKRKVSWQDALLLLFKKIKNKKIVLFFDEFQWMANMRQELVSILKWAWDNYFLNNLGCKLIVCGSISSFMVRNVLKSKALYGRIDLEIHLKPLSVSETKEFLKEKYSDLQALETFLITGGIPQYIKEINPSLSLIQNLNHLAFKPEGYFVSEYNRLFISHFARNDVYDKIIKALAKKSPQTTDELAKSVHQKKGGTFTRYLEDLELADFIDRFVPIDKTGKSRFVKYRIDDEFLHFYFTFIEPNKNSIQKETLQSYQILTGAQYEQWKGYSFERFCRKHARLVAKKLGFSGIKYESGSWFRKAKEKSAQIDLLFVRADNVLTVCEAKFVNKIQSKIIDDVEQKLEVLSSFYSFPVQKVLILGKEVSIPERVKGYFDEIVYSKNLYQ